MKKTALLLALLVPTLAAQPNAAVQRAANGGIVVNGAAANLTNNGTITNSGAITNAEGGTVDLSQGAAVFQRASVEAAITDEYGTLTLANGVLSIDTTGATTFDGPLTQSGNDISLDGGSLTLSDGSQLHFTGFGSTFGGYYFDVTAPINAEGGLTVENGLSISGVVQFPDLVYFFGGAEVDSSSFVVNAPTTFSSTVRFLNGVVNPWTVADGGTGMRAAGEGAFLVAHIANGGDPRFGNVTLGTGLAWGTVSDGAGGQQPATLKLGNTTITLGTYGNGTATGQFTVNAQGQLTAGANVPIQLALAQVTNLTTSLSALAPLASPALTGLPTAPTQGNSTNNTTVATTGFVKTAIGNIAPAFTTVTVGGNSVTANSTDTLYFVAGTNIAITVNNTTKTVTINATASPSTNLVSGGTHNGGIAGFVSGSNTTLFSSNSTLDQGGNMTVAGDLTVQGYTTFNGDFGQVGNIDGTPNFSAGATTSDGGTVPGSLDSATQAGQVMVTTGTGNPYQIDTSGIIVDSDYWGARLTAPGTFDAGGPNWGEPAGQGGFHVDGDLGSVTMYNDATVHGELYLPAVMSGSQGILVVNGDGSVAAVHYSDLAGY